MTPPAQGDASVLHRLAPRFARGAGLGVLLLSALLAGCDDGSMAHQPKENPYASAATGPGPAPDGRTEWQGGQQGWRETPLPAPPLTPALLERGRMVYGQICAPCHSELGDGRGMVVQRGLSPPPSYHIARLREAPTRHFYDVITEGYGAMYSYAQRVRPSDRWAIAAYIRALQRSTDGRLPDLPPAEQRKLASAPPAPGPDQAPGPAPGRAQGQAPDQRTER